ncbi:Atxe2 family lasso peptide isopeptidase [Sphingopyxis sp.]|uniref:Atxe2 family lasso peptide isopeptidase n=1 Tax=Sphingopyxis sp. TaxID=1908224 RepID=UPI0035B2C499
MTAADLVEIAEISGPTLSPDGTRIIFRVARPSLEKGETRLEWYVGAVDGTPPQLAADGGLARIDGAGLVSDQTPVWDPDSRGFRFLAYREGAATIWHWRDGSGAREEVRNDADIVDFALSADGMTLRYTVGATRAEVQEAETRAYEDGVLVDASVDLNQALAGGMIDDGERIMLRFPGPWFDRKRILWDAPRRAVEVAATPAAGHSPTIFEAAPTRVSQGSRVVSANGAIATVQREAASARLTITHQNHGTITCKAPACRSPKMLAAAWRPDHDSVLLFLDAGSAREDVWEWRVGSPTARKVTTTDGALRLSDRPLRCAIARDAMLCIEARPLIPPRLVRIMVETGDRSILFEPNAALARRVDAHVMPLELRGGYSAIFLRPRHMKGPVPVVVQNYHCAGFLKGGTGEELPMLPLAEHGIAVLCIDPFRGPPGSGQEGTYELARTVIASAIAELAKSNLVDPAKVGIAGFSHSSGVALWALRNGGGFAAATIGTGQISPHYFWTNAVPDRGFEAMLKDYWNIGDPDKDPGRWKIASAVDDVSAIDTPILMQLPDAEAPWTAEFHTKLKRAGKPAELVVYADELHNKYQPRHKRAVYERNLDWFRFWLTGEEDPAPGKSTQYERWRHYRAGQSLPVPAR